MNRCFIIILGFVFFFLNISQLVGDDKKSLPLIKHISTDDNRVVKLQFTNQQFFYCVSEGNKVIYPVDQRSFVLPLNAPGDSYTYTNFKFYDQVTERLEGEITFRYRPNESHKDEYVTLSRNTFSFLKASDEYGEIKVHNLSESDRERLLEKFRLWNPSALGKILSLKADTIERCSLIIQYIWSSKPLVSYPPPYVYGLGLIDRLEGLENKEFALICGGYASLFTEIAIVLMPDVKVRLVHGFECHYPTVYENIHVNSHAFVEVWVEDQWIYIDPFFQLYIRNKQGELLNSFDFRKAVENGEAQDLVPVRIHANCPTNFSFEGSYLEPHDLLKAYGFFKCFGWLRFWDLTSI